MISYEKGLQKKVARLFELSTSYYNPFFFLINWKNSKIAQSILNYDNLLLAQSKYYILNDMKNKELGKYDDRQYTHYADMMYWLGYIITKFCIEEQITWKELFDVYDIERFFMSYDVLHTLSSKNACEDLKKYFTLTDKYKSMLITQN